MRHITTDELRQMAAQRAILQGCGGDPQDG
jgi:hypothetical protein